MDKLTRIENILNTVAEQQETNTNDIQELTKVANSALSIAQKSKTTSMQCEQKIKQSASSFQQIDRKLGEYIQTNLDYQKTMENQLKGLQTEIKRALDFLLNDDFDPVIVFPIVD